MAADRPVPERELTTDEVLESDPDYMRAMDEAERRDPNYPIKVAINEIQVQLTYGMPVLKFLGWAIVVLLSLILWRLW